MGIKSGLTPRQKKIGDFFTSIGYRFDANNSEIETDLSKRPLSISLEDDEVLQTLVQIIDPDVILEFGTWLGRSAYNLLKEAREGTRLVAVDTFLGSYEHWLNLSPSKEFSLAELNVINGKPHLYEDFKKNMKLLNLETQIFPFPSTTETAHNVFSKLKIDFPLIFVDAAHDYDSVLNDLKRADNLLSRKDNNLYDGVIVGDDYESWTSVRSAVNDFADEFERSIIYGANRYILLDTSQTAEAVKSVFLQNFGWKIRKSNLRNRELSLQAFSKLEDRNLDLLKELAEIKASKSWKLIRVYARIRGFFLN